VLKDPEPEFLLAAIRTVHAGTASIVEPDSSLLPLWVSRPNVEIEPTTEEYAVVITASIAKHFIGKGKSVGLITYGQRREVIMADPGERQLNKIFEALSVVVAVEGASWLTTAS